MADTANLFFYIEFEGDDVTETLKEKWVGEDVYFAAKGTEYFEFLEKQKIKKHRSENYFSVTFEIPQENRPLSELLIEFLEKQGEKISSVNNNGNMYRKIHISVYPEAIHDVVQYNIDLPAEVMRKILDLGLELSLIILKM